jgi:hypothetical protein
MSRSYHTYRDKAKFAPRNTFEFTTSFKSMSIFIGYAKQSQYNNKCSCLVFNLTKQRSKAIKHATYVQYVISSYGDGNYCHKATYVQHIVQFKFQPGVLYKPITCMSEDILPVTGLKAVKSSYNICCTHQTQSSFWNAIITHRILGNHIVGDWFFPRAFGNECELCVVYRCSSKDVTSLTFAKLAFSFVMTLTHCHKF